MQAIRQRLCAVGSVGTESDASKDVSVHHNQHAYVCASLDEI